MGLQIDVGGNLTPITKSLTELKQDLANFRNELNRSTDPVKVAQLNAELRKTEDEIKRIRNIGPIIPASASRGADQAAASLTNVGRVAQDLPFGFIGIQNNLNPLLESFQRLKAESGSSSAALKALGSSLIGAGGLGLALSLVSSAILIYQNGIAGFNSKTKEAKDKAEEFIKTLRTAAAVAGEAAASQNGSIAQVQALANVVQNTNAAYDERKRALQELKEINKSYFGDLKLEEGQMTVLTDRVNDYTKAIVAQAVLKGFTDEISRVSVELAKQDRVLKTNVDEINRLRTALSNTKQSETSLTGEDRLSQKYVNLKNALADSEDSFAKQLGVVNNLRANFDDLNGSIDGAVQETLKFRDLNAPEKQKKEVDALKARLEALEKIKNVTKDLNTLVGIQESIFEVQVKIAVRDQKKNKLSDKEIQQLIKGYQDQLNEVFKDQAISLEAIPKIKFSQVSRVEIPKQITDVISKATGNEKIRVDLHDIRVRFLRGKKTKQIEGIENVVKELNESIKNSLGDLKANVAETIGTALGEVLSGGDVGEALKNGAKQLLNILGSFMQQLGKYIIGAAIKIQALKATLKQFAISNPALAIAGGIVLIAAGAALKNVQFEGPKFAQGGIVTGPTIGMVGEAGKEVIMPLRRLPDLLGGQRNGQPIVLSAGLKIDGRSLVAFLTQETNAFKRVN